MTTKRNKPARVVGAKAICDVIYRKLRREARKTELEDWGELRIQRDRYVQGMRDAATIVAQIRSANR